jgi:hypothetical protein
MFLVDGVQGVIIALIATVDRDSFLVLGMLGCAGD